MGWCQEPGSSMPRMIHESNEPKGVCYGQVAGFSHKVAQDCSEPCMFLNGGYCVAKKLENPPCIPRREEPRETKETEKPPKRKFWTEEEKELLRGDLGEAAKKTGRTRASCRNKANRMRKSGELEGHGGKKTGIYELRLGDKVISTGTFKEMAQEFGITEERLRNFASSKRDNGFTAVRIGERAC